MTFHSVLETVLASFSLLFWFYGQQLLKLIANSFLDPPSLYPFTFRTHLYLHPVILSSLHSSSLSIQSGAYLSHISFLVPQGLCKQHCTSTSIHLSSQISIKPLKEIWLWCGSCLRILLQFILTTLINIVSSCIRKLDNFTALYPCFYCLITVLL